MAEIKLPSRADIIAHCGRCTMAAQGHAFSDDIWINSTPTRASSASPLVYDTFTAHPPDGGAPDTYIVMERMRGEEYATYKHRRPECEEGDAIERIADAVRHIWTLPIPADSGIGPLGPSTVPVNRFFSDCGAGRTFATVQDLQDWINGKLEQRGHLDRPALDDEPPCITHGDLTQHNIMMTTDGAVGLVGWGFAGVYPRALEEYGLLNQFNLEGRRLARALHISLFGPKLSNLMRPLALAQRFHTFSY